MPYFIKSLPSKTPWSRPKGMRYWSSKKKTKRKKGSKYVQTPPAQYFLCLPFPGIIFQLDQGSTAKPESNSSQSPIKIKIKTEQVNSINIEFCFFYSHRYYFLCIHTCTFFLVTSNKINIFNCTRLVVIVVL